MVFGRRKEVEKELGLKKDSSKITKADIISAPVALPEPPITESEDEEQVVPGEKLDSTVTNSGEIPLQEKEEEPLAASLEQLGDNSNATTIKKSKTNLRGLKKAARSKLDIVNSCDENGGEVQDTRPLKRGQSNMSINHESSRKGAVSSINKHRSINGLDQHSMNQLDKIVGRQAKANGSVDTLASGTGGNVGSSSALMNTASLKDLMNSRKSLNQETANAAVPNPLNNGGGKVMASKQLTRKPTHRAPTQTCESVLSAVGSAADGRSKTGARLQGVLVDSDNANESETTALGVPDSCEGGYSVLLAAAGGHWEPIIKILDEHKPDNGSHPLSTKDFTSGYTALHWAVKHKAEHAALQILKAQAVSVNSQTFAGYTPLHLACMAGDGSMVTLLLQFGADCRIRDQTGRLAKVWAHGSAREALSDAGKNIPEAAEYGSIVKPTQEEIERHYFINDFRMTLPIALRGETTSDYHLSPASHIREMRAAQLAADQAAAEMAKGNGKDSKSSTRTSFFGRSKKAKTDGGNGADQDPSGSPAPTKKQRKMSIRLSSPERKMSMRLPERKMSMRKPELDRRMSMRRSLPAPVLKEDDDMHRSKTSNTRKSLVGKK
eukprot:Clim_evm13s214 gene=Clim_evmTU13s214